MKYFFFDVDGTLHSPNHGISQSTKNTIKKLINKGWFVAIATGRSYPGAKEILAQTGIEYAIVDGGHKGYYKDTVLFNEPIDHAICKEIIEDALRLGIPVGISDDTTCYLQDERLVEKMSREHEWMKICKVDTFMIDNIFVKKVFLDMTEKEVSLFPSLTKINHLYLPVSELVVTDQDHKPRGIQQMLEHVGYAKGDVIVFGDSRNDIAMFNEATIAICMGSGVEQAKRKAHYVTEDVDHDGIEKACHHFHWI